MRLASWRALGSPFGCGALGVLVCLARVFMPLTGCVALGGARWAPCCFPPAGLDVRSVGRRVVGRVSLALQVRRLTPTQVGCVVQVLLREIDGSEAVRE